VLPIRPGGPCGSGGAMRSAASPAAYLRHICSAIGPRWACWCSTHLAQAGSLTRCWKSRKHSLGGDSLRVITAICGQPPAQDSWGAFPSSSIYSACIDASSNDAFRIVPGLGDAGDRPLRFPAAPRFKIQAPCLLALWPLRAGSLHRGSRVAR